MAEPQTARTEPRIIQISSRTQTPTKVADADHAALAPRRPPTLTQGALCLTGPSFPGLNIPARDGRSSSEEVRSRSERPSPRRALSLCLFSFSACLASQSFFSFSYALRWSLLTCVDAWIENRLYRAPQPPPKNVAHPASVADLNTTAPTSVASQESRGRLIWQGLPGAAMLSLRRAAQPKANRPSRRPLTSSQGRFCQSMPSSPGMSDPTASAATTRPARRPMWFFGRYPLPRYPELVSVLELDTAFLDLLFFEYLLLSPLFPFLLVLDRFSRRSAAEVDVGSVVVASCWERSSGASQGCLVKAIASLARQETTLRGFRDESGYGGRD